jgi:SAM-dependent methyltransferase
MLLHSIDYFCCPACSGDLELRAEKQTEAEVVQGILECLCCQRRFEINDGLPNLTFPETLAESDLQQQKRFDREPAYDFRPRALVLGIWEYAFFETRAREKVIKGLDLKRNASVLETGVGTGANLPIIAKRTGKHAQLDGLDISSGTLKVARRKMRRKGVQVTLAQGNASYLPYKAEQFDGVLHLGALNEFAEKKRAIEEMHRVAKPGAKIVICDEGLAPGKENTLWGRWILSFIPAYTNKPPVDSIPIGVEDLKVNWVWQGTAWVIEFRKRLYA